MGDSVGIIIDELKNIRNNLKQFINDFNRAEQCCREGRRILTSGQYDIKRLKEINAFIGEVDEAFVKAMFKEQLADDFYLEEKDEIDESVRMYNKSASYYKMLADAIPELISILDETEKYLTDKKE